MENIWVSQLNNDKLYNLFIAYNNILVTYDHYSKEEINFFLDDLINEKISNLNENLIALLN